MNGLTAGLLALGEDLSIVALGGDRDSVPAAVTHTPEPLHPPTNMGWMLVGLPWAAARASVDVIHAPAYTAPFWSSAPVVLTIHDVSYQRHPEWFPYRRDRFRRAFYRRSADAAAWILTDSMFSASEITAAYNIPAGRIVVVPLAADPAFAVAQPTTPRDLPPQVRTPFLLHVGDLHERRNLVTVVQAMLAARERGGIADSLSLVLAGVDRGVSDGLLATAAQAGAADLIVSLGSVSEQHLHALYREATALVYPSLYEGFGFPVLEAMASGTPVIASRAASIPEVLGDAGLLLDPRDENAWTDAIIRVTQDEGERQRMAAAGRERAATFTWGRTARSTLEVYRRAIGGRPAR